ncbi:MAG: biopolymer transporter ExbD [Acidobacteria bacterium]|nr:biopolymer transporter ExbD [Acidobacteriota bacterium]
MAIHVGSGNGGGYGRGRQRWGHAMAEINIIPLVDVTLVLLIIFMVTAQVMEFGLEIKVPKVDSTKQSVEELPIVSITKDARLFLADRPVTAENLVAEIRKRYPNQKAVYVRGDKDTILQPVASVISLLGRAEYEVKLVTQGN